MRELPDVRGEEIATLTAPPAVPQETRANDARIDAAVEAAVDTVSLSPIAQALPAAPAVSAPAVVGSAVPPATAEQDIRAASAPTGAEGLSAGTPALTGTPSGRVDGLPAAAASAPGGGADPWLADAFDLLLAEEQGEAPAALYGGSYGLSEADLDRIAVRVADRLTRGSFADTVARIVTDVSERLVREEIARIRDSAAGAAPAEPQ